jgi:hypothetical protein
MISMKKGRVYRTAVDSCACILQDPGMIIKHPLVFLVSLSVP